MTDSSSSGGPESETEPDPQPQTQTYTATVDRIVDDKIAVVLVEAGGETVSQLDVDVATIPEAGQHEGAVLSVVVGVDDEGCPTDGDRILEATYQPEETRSRRRSAQDRLDRLSTRLADRDDDHTRNADHGDDRTRDADRD